MQDTQSLALDLICFLSVLGVLLHRDPTPFATGHFAKDTTETTFDFPEGEFKPCSTGSLQHF